MPQLVVGGVTVKVREFTQLPHEQTGDWRKRAWRVDALLADDAEAAALRTAVQDSVPREYGRAINGQLRGGPIITCSGDRLGGTVSCGVELGDQPLVIDSHTRQEIHHTLTLTLREA